MQPKIKPHAPDSPLDHDASRLENSDDGHGNQYFLVVRCEGGWGSSEIEELDFAVTVELRHEAQIALYQRIEERVRIRA